MTARSWTNTGFWVLLGFSAGMLASDLLGTKTTTAATASAYEEYRMATGESNNQSIDLVWLLDYRYAKLQCIVMNQKGQLGGMTEIDLLAEIKPKREGVKLHFMMVTGKFSGGTQVADVCYLAETTQGILLAVASPQRFNNNGGPVEPPRVIARFSFRPEEDK